MVADAPRGIATLSFMGKYSAIVATSAAETITKRLAVGKKKPMQIKHTTNPANVPSRVLLKPIFIFPIPFPISAAAASP